MIEYIDDAWIGESHHEEKDIKLGNRYARVKTIDAMEEAVICVNAADPDSPIGLDLSLYEELLAIACTTKPVLDHGKIARIKKNNPFGAWKLFITEIQTHNGFAIAEEDVEAEKN